MNLQVIDAAERREATADGLGQIYLFGRPCLDRLGQYGSQFGFHRTSVSGRANAQPLLDCRIDVANCQGRHGALSLEL